MGRSAALKADEGPQSSSKERCIPSRPRFKRSVRDQEGVSSKWTTARFAPLQQSTLICSTFACQVDSVVLGTLFGESMKNWRIGKRSNRSVNTAGILSYNTHRLIAVQLLPLGAFGVFSDGLKRLQRHFQCHPAPCPTGIIGPSTPKRSAGNNSAFPIVKAAIANIVEMTHIVTID